MANKFRGWFLTEEAKQLAGDNLGLAFKYSRQYYNKGVDHDELDSAALYGLCKAAEKFDPSKGYKFSTYATMPLRGYVADTYQRELKKWVGQTVQEGDEQGGLDLTLLPAAHNTEREADERLLRQVIADSLDCLNDKERYVITMYYSLHGGKGMKLREIAKEINRTPQGVGMILNRCYDKIREQDNQRLVDKLYQYWIDMR